MWQNIAQHHTTDSTDSEVLLLMHHNDQVENHEYIQSLR